MYYAHFILSKKGPLAKIWLAAHWDKKLTKAQVYETNIESTIETILEPKMKLALRTSGHLLVGVCRIYSRKIKYLLADCNEAFVKIKMAFRPGLVDLPREKQQANVDAITLQEKFPEFDLNFTDINMEDIDLSTNMTIQQARVEDITLKEDYGHMIITQDDDFGDMGFGMGSLLMNGDHDGDADEMFLNHSSHDINSLLNGRKSVVEPMDAFDNDAPFNVSNEFRSPDEQINGEMPIVPTLFEEQTTLHTTTNVQGGNEEDEESAEAAVNRATENAENANPLLNEEEKQELENEKENQGGSVVGDNQAKQAAAKALDKQRQTRKRKKLIVDEIKEIDSATMKQQLSDTTNIVSTLELAPPTRKLMYWKESGTIEKLFMNTSRELNCKVLQSLYKNNMTTRRDQVPVNAKVAKHGSTGESTGVVGSLLLSANSSSLLWGQEQERQRENVDANQNENLLPMADTSIEQNDMSKQRIDASMDNSVDLMFGQQANLDITLASQQNITLDHPVSVLMDDLNDIADRQVEVTPHVGEKRKSVHHPASRKSVNNTSQNQTIVESAGCEDLTEETINDQMKLLSKRAKTMISLLNKNLNKHSNVGLFELTRRNNRKHVVQKFYSLLLLKKFDCIDVTQAEMYGDIIISKSDKFDTYITNAASQSFVTA